MSDEGLPAVYIEDGKIVADSREVAVSYNKRHTHVLDSIRNLESICADVFFRPNFRLHEINDLQGKKYTSHYTMTRDGFVMLVMRFTGEKAAGHQIAWINQFNQMEEELRRRPAIVDYSDPKLFIGMMEHLRGQVEESEKKAREEQQLRLTAETKIETDKPKVEFVDWFVRADDDFGVRATAKAIRAPEKRFVAWLIQKGILQRLGEKKTLVSCRWAVVKGLVTDVVWRDEDGKAKRTTPLFTGRGVGYCAKNCPDARPIDNSVFENWDKALQKDLFSHGNASSPNGADRQPAEGKPAEEKGQA